MATDIERILSIGSVADIRKAYADRTVSVVETVGWFLKRIDAFNANGPKINAVRTLSPDALAHAARADGALASGQALGPLHGIPVLLKDNVATGDGMPASAGAAALRDFRPKRDATLVARLRRAGAIVVGKTNMTEFADYVSDVMPSGFSAAGGVVRNPHGVDYGRGLGSSVGSAAAVAAGFAPITIGSETQNSIQTPASVSSVYGFKPTVGAVSRAGLVPLVPSQDSPGPLTRCVEDAALVFSVIAGPDARDALSLIPLNSATAQLRDASRDSLRLDWLRLGVPRRTIADRSDVASAMPAFEQALSRLGAAGVKIVDPCDFPSAEQVADVRSCVFRSEFKDALNLWLEDSQLPGLDSLAHLIAWNESRPDVIPYGQSLLIAAQSSGGYEDPAYRADRARDIALARDAGIHAALSFADADALIVPMGAASKMTGKAGAPVLSIPMGLDAQGEPCGISLIGGFASDAKLLRIGAAIASKIGKRILPNL